MFNNLTMALKTNLHFHAAEDEQISRHNIYQLIDHAQKRGFDALAYTPHRKFLFSPEHARYAQEKNILLIPGIELEIGKKHILVLNCDKEIEKVKTFKELSDHKNKNPHIFIIAPHPFVFSRKSLRAKLLENIHLFDAVEMSVFSNKLFNFNKRARHAAEKHGKPFIATSDTHFLNDIERGYALVEAQNKTAEAFFSAIRENKFQNKLNSMSPLAMIKYRAKVYLSLILKKISFILFRAKN